MVSGTRLIKKHLLSIKPSIGIINLHTGLSPYVKGGPNCTNWCIANDEFHLIGNTVMWIDIGIDTGNIITTDVVTFIGNENLNRIHLKVMEHANELYLKALRVLINNPTQVHNHKQQEIADGKTYFNKMWGIKQKFYLIINLSRFKKSITSESYKRKRKSLKLIGLPEVKDR